LKKLVATYWLWILVPLLILAAMLAFALSREGSPQFGYAM
jgi:hypothetical protein